MITLSCSKKEKVDLIVHNATVYTVNEDFATAEAFAVKDGRFVAVGTNADILGKYSADSTLDMQGKFVGLVHVAAGTSVNDAVKARFQSAGVYMVKQGSKMHRIAVK